MLAPGERLVVVANPDAFEFRYGVGTATIAGAYTGNFRNSGEHVRLEAADASVIADFTYGDSSPWPDAADGAGYSLVLAGGDPTDPLAWRSSTAIGGDPGASNSTPYTGGDAIDYAIAPAGLMGEIVGDEFLLQVDINLAADGVDLTAQFSTDLDTWTNAPAGDLISRTNHGDGTATWDLPGAVAPEPKSATVRQDPRYRPLVSGPRS